MILFELLFLLYVVNLGMATVGSKTPVSILNEYFTATTGRLPSYDLIKSSAGHNPTFTYRVTADKYYAEGSGSSKQSAKHNAAQQLYDIIKENGESKCVLNSVTCAVACPQENHVAFNAVGLLMSYCEEHNLPMPLYEPLKEEGPPHEKTFTIKCAVSNVFEIGVARTKKQAKHHAANALLTKLKTIYGEEINPLVLKTAEAATPAVTTDKLVNEAYFNLTKNKRSAAGYDSAYIANQFRFYSRLTEKSPTLVKAITDKSWVHQPIETLKAIAAEINVQPLLKEIRGTSCVTYFAGLPISPILTTSADTFNEAAKNSIETMLSFII